MLPKLSGRPLTAVRFVIHSARPSSSVAMARVVMNGSTPSITTTTALKTPATTASSRASSTAATTFQWWLVYMTAAVVPLSPITDAIEKSNSPTHSGQSAAMHKKTSSPLAPKMIWTVPCRRNSGVAPAKAAASSTQTPTTANRRAISVSDQGWRVITGAAAGAVSPPAGPGIPAGPTAGKTGSVIERSCVRCY